MQLHTLSQLLEQHAADDDLYLEFLRESTLSMGLYILPAGARDPQQPHAEDEVYVVMAGEGRIQVADEDKPVAHGSIVFVPARVPHRFHDIRTDLQVLVFFAPPESES